MENVQLTTFAQYLMTNLSK